MGAVEALKRYLEDHKVTQVEFAERMGVKQSTVSDWLNGHITPSTKNLRAISAATNLTIDELLANPVRARGASRERRATP